ncbi:MAG TPA: sulfotransferase, partial [Roseiflexaceae bacterium]|nr:sulfotransferase [Roseiflexaceae bacterium]
RGVTSTLFRSDAYRKLNVARRYIVTAYKVRKHAAMFREVQAFCFFVGHNKSGTSMTGALLDAHPDVILSDEEDALQYVPAGFSREQIFHLLLKGSRREAMKGRVTARRLTPYSFEVPGQWQGRYHTLRVIGDSTSGSSTRRLARDPALLEQLQRTMGDTRVKLIQVIRNPYDPISVMMVRGKRSFENACEHYFASCQSLVALRNRLDSAQLLALKYEDFIAEPEMHLTTVCRYLGIAAHEDYINACASILHKEPDRRRTMVPWNDRWIAIVQQQIERYDFLQGYSFEG